MPLLDATHDPALRSWVPAANAPGNDFPIQNLPLGRFRRAGSGEAWRVGVAIGAEVLDLKLAAQQCPWADDVHPLLALLADGDLAAFMALGWRAWATLRGALSAALAEGSDQGPFLELCLLPRTAAEMAMPCAIHDHAAFQAGIHHMRAIGRLRKPEQALLPNYPWLPIGHHGRASSVGLGGAVLRPQGQLRINGSETPAFGPSRRLDHGIELGVLVGGTPGTGTPGQPLGMAEAEQRLFGLTLVNGWTARDLQGWEQAPLGPFLSRGFATSISPWVVSMAALAPFRRPAVRPAGDPAPLPHLDSPFNREAGAIDITLEVWLKTRAMKRALRLSQASLLDAYWTPAQLLAHLASSGSRVQVGDLLSTGTISGAGPGQGGSMMEATQGGRQLLQLPGGEQRAFLQDGDTVTLRAYCQAPGAMRIGFGELSGTVIG